jgi:hypothetical protein
LLSLLADPDWHKHNPKIMNSLYLDDDILEIDDDEPEYENENDE